MKKLALLVLFLASVTVVFAIPPYKYLVFKRSDLLNLSAEDQLYPFKNYGSSEGRLVSDSLETARHSNDGNWIMAKYPANHSGIKSWFTSKGVPFDDYTRNQIDTVLAGTNWALIEE